MKLNNLILAAFATILVLSGCQKDLEAGADGISLGTLKRTTGGDCLPVTVNGIVRVDSVLTNDNYVDVQVNVTVAGSFDIKSDTVNGYSFRKTGTVGTGVNTIRLYASGKAITTGVNTFTISYGLTTCSFDITVFGSGSGTALYTLGGSPGNCSVSAINGIYDVNQAMTAANTVEMTVNVSGIGTYIITGPVINGIAFNATGSFTNVGVQNIFLRASGTPFAAGTFNYPVTNSVTSCGFSITFINSAATVYTLGGSPGNCTGVILGGTYMAGFPLTGANTARIDVNVTVAGPYSISTGLVNNFKFSSTGTFTATGAQTVTLVGTGTPITATASNFTVSGGGSTCNFAVPVNPAPVGAATFNCAASVVNGTYYFGSAVNASNSISLDVNVTSVGTYSISSGASVNGVTFSKTGTFSATGTQTIVLPASGTPAATGAFNYTINGITGATGSCPFSITAVAGSPGFYSCKIDGVYMEFTDRAKGDNDDSGTPYLYLNGYTGPPTGGTVPQFQIFITNNNNAAVAAGTYNENGFLLPNGYRIEIDYTAENPDMSVTIWNTSSNILPPPHPPFTVTITSVTATRVIGTFSGQLTNTLQGSTILKTVTEGVFNLPIN